MAPLIGREMAERLFLQRFATLCVDPLFHVRKVCAANFGDFSGMVGSDSTEQTLVCILIANHHELLYHMTQDYTHPKRKLK